MDWQLSKSFKLLESFIFVKKKPNFALKIGFYP